MLLWYFVNLVLLLAAGVLASVWVLYYTQSFEIIGGLLGLGGAFAWIAFVSNVIKADRKTKLQDGIDWLLEKWWALLIVGGIAAAFFIALPLRTGAIIFDSGPDDATRVARIDRLDAAGSLVERAYAEAVLTPRGVQRILVAVDWSDRSAYRVKLSGLPSAVVRPGILDRKRLVVPDSLLSRPILLIWPQLYNSRSLSQQPDRPDLVLLLRGNEIGRIKAYDGKAVWVGGDSDLALPSELLDRWRRDLKGPGLPEDVVAFAQWTPPRSVADNFPLAPGDRVTIVIRAPGATQPSLTQTVLVRPIDAPRDAIQGVLLNEITFRPPS